MQVKTNIELRRLIVSKLELSMNWSKKSFYRFGPNIQISEENQQSQSQRWGRSDFFEFVETDTNTLLNLNISEAVNERRTPILWKMVLEGKQTPATRGHDRDFATQAIMTRSIFARAPSRRSCRRLLLIQWFCTILDFYFLVESGVIFVLFTIHMWNPSIGYQPRPSSPRRRSSGTTQKLPMLRRLPYPTSSPRYNYIDRRQESQLLSSKV